MRWPEITKMIGTGVAVAIVGAVLFSVAIHAIALF
jgi:hypothetical protein